MPSSKILESQSIFESASIFDNTLIHKYANTANIIPGYSIPNLSPYDFYSTLWKYVLQEIKLPHQERSSGRLGFMK